MTAPLPEPKIALDDPRRPDLLSLRARQLLALCVDGGAGDEPLYAMWALARLELGPTADHELLGTVLGLVTGYLPATGRAELVARARAGIPPLLMKLGLEK